MTIGLCLLLLLLLLLLLSGIPQTLLRSRETLHREEDGRKMVGEEEGEEGYLLTAESLPKVATRLLKGLFKGLAD